MRRIILASTSRYRRRLLKQLGLPFKAASPQFKEHIDQNVSPELLVKHLASQKAKSLKENYPDALIIGSDQVFVDSRGRILGKPGSLEGAVKQLKAMAGKKHEFFTGVSVFDSASGQSLTDVAKFSVQLRDLSDDQIEAYVQKERPADCAGSFKVEGLGIALMESMEGDDYNSLIGLPLIKLVSMLKQFDVEVF